MLSLGKKAKWALILLAIAIIGSLLFIFPLIDLINSQNRITLATTTSTYDSGLLDYLLPTFEQKTRIKVDIVSVGTGQALEIGKRGDADVLLVHSRVKENEFIANGYGVHRVCVMYNDFIIVGPSSDPAGIKNQNITTAMENLKSAGDAGKIKFYSRGDDSGTYSKELELWALINFTPRTLTDKWYFETGAGMGTTITITNENDGYTLIDRGTWLAMKDSLSLIVLVEGDQILINPYGAILINPSLYPDVKYDKAIKFVGFLVSEEGQNLIGSFTKNGEQLFHPIFGHCNETLGCNTTSEEVNFWKKYNGGYTG